jgi:hypothetical protein
VFWPCRRCPTRVILTRSRACDRRKYVMEPSSLGPPRTPTRGSSEGPTPPPRNSMEDADSSVTRKRPRLDSGDRAYRSMSADPDRSAAGTPGLPRLISSSPGRENHMPAGRMQEPSPSRGVLATPSKVTINVRDAASMGTPPQPAPPASNMAETLGRTVIPSTPAQPHSPAVVDSTPPARTSAPSSQADSPKIEIAEPEFFDEPSGPTIWLKANGASGAADVQKRLLAEFPACSRTSGSWKTFFQKLGQHILQGGMFPHPPPPLSPIATPGTSVIPGVAALDQMQKRL